MGLGQALDAAAASSRFGTKHGKLPRGKGVGIAGSAYMSGAGLPIYWNDLPHSGAHVKIDRGGGVTVSCGTAELGQGSDMVLAMVTAEALGVRPEDVHVVSGDTTLTPVGSRVLLVARDVHGRQRDQGRRAEAARAARGRRDEKLGIPGDRLAFAHRRVFDRDQPDHGMTFVEAAVAAEAKHGTLVSVGSYKPPADIRGQVQGRGRRAFTGVLLSGVRRRSDGRSRDRRSEDRQTHPGPRLRPLRSIR
jgi:CO/xanthine dehydrogenase Mo-binding subunit